MSPRVKRALDGWQMFWFRPQAPLALGICRLLFYGAMLYLPGQVDFTLCSKLGRIFWAPGYLDALQGTAPPSASVLMVLQVLWRISLVTSLLGWRTRLSTSVACLLGFYLLSLPFGFGRVYHETAAPAIALAVMAISRCGDALSVDALFAARRGGSPPAANGEYRWPIQMVRVTLCLMFFSAALNKLRDGGLAYIFTDTMQMTLLQKSTALGFWVAQHPRLCQGLGAYTLAAEFFYPLALCSRWLAFIWVSAILSLLIGIDLTMGIGFLLVMALHVFWIPWNEIFKRGAAVPGLAWLRARTALIVALAALGLLANPGLSRAGEPAAKAPLTGLIDMGDIAFHRTDEGEAHNDVAELDPYAGIFSGIAVNVAWWQVEPTPGVLVTTEIDRALADIRAYNQRNPQHPLAARLRVWPGTTAPDWAKRIGGDPVHILHRGLPITVGRYWTPAYRAAWRDLQTKLAARYDDEPLVREVAVESGSSMTDEPFIIPGDPLSDRNLLAAGFTDQAYRETLMGAMEDYAGWKKTDVEYPFSPYRAIGSGRPVPDLNFTFSVMQAFRHALGPRAILSNHGLGAPLPPQLVPLFAEIAKLGPPTNFQMVAPKGVILPQAIPFGVQNGAHAIELWSVAKYGGFLSMPPDTVRALGALVREH